MFRKYKKSSGVKGFILPGGSGTPLRITPMTLIERPLPIDNIVSRGDNILKYFKHYVKLQVLPPTFPIYLRALKVYVFKRDLPFMVV